MRRAIALCNLAFWALGLLSAACVGGTEGRHAGQRPTTDLKQPPPPPDEPPPAPKASSETFLVHYTFSLAGKIAASGTFDKGVSRADYGNCLNYLTQEERGVSVGENGTSTLGFDNAPVQGGTVGFSVTLRIHGPGTYSLGRNDMGTVSDGAGDESHIFSYGYGEGNSGTVTINQDGSVKISFSGWKNPSNEPESGTVSWACK